MKPVKALILGILLLVPILIFIFVSVFGTHHFSLKTYYPRLDDSGNVVYNAAGDTVFHQIPYFSLTAQDGSEFTAEQLSASISVINFFDTVCQDTCQEVFSELLRVQEVFENNPDVKLVSITANPDADSLSALRKFAGNIGVNGNTWVLLTGEKQEIYTLASQGFYRPIEATETLPRYSHEVLLVDKEKHIRGIYNGSDRNDVDRLVTEINVLLDGYSKRK